MENGFNNLVDIHICGLWDFRLWISTRLLESC